MSNCYKFSIITVCLNAELEIAKTLDSIACQTYKNYEVIIVDGLSSDRTVEIIKQYAPSYPIKWISEKDRGIYDAMNKGLGMITGDIISFLNSGDQLFNNLVLENVNANFKQQWQVAYGQSISIDNKLGKEEEMNLHQVDVLSLFGNVINHQSIFARASVFKDYGGFDNRYKIYADYEWYLGLVINNKWDIHFINTPICKYQRGGFSDMNYHTIGVKELDAIRRTHFKTKFNFLKNVVYKRQYLWATRRILKINFVRHLLNKYLKWSL